MQLFLRGRIQQRLPAAPTATRWTAIGGGDMRMDRPLPSPVVTFLEHRQGVHAGKRNSQVIQPMSTVLSRLTTGGPVPPWPARLERNFRARPCGGDH